MTWLWLYGAFVFCLYAFIATVRFRHMRREAAHAARRAEMWRRLEAAGYYAAKPPPPPPPPRKRWFDTDGVEIFED